MKFPYGISDFDSLITEKYHCVDRTDHTPLLEEAGKQLLFLRPRRFGKSLLLEQLDHEALRSLPAVQSKQREAEVGLARYRAKSKSKFGELPRWRSFSVIAVGFERLVFSPSE